MAGQVWHLYPRQEQQTRVIDDEAQIAATLLATPANPPIARGRLPSSRSKKQTGQRPAVFALGQVLQIFAHAIAVPQIMVTLQEELEEQGLGTASGNGLDSHRLEPMEGTFNSTLVMIHLRDLVIAQSIDRSGASGRQLDMAQSLQFQKQTASGHILESAGLVAPVPSGTQLTRQPRPIGAKMALK